MKDIGQSRIEWALLGIIAVVCAVLSFLQYYWTGELSRAEPVLLRAGLNEQVRRLVQSFDQEIFENCSALLPEAKELHERSTAEAHRIRYAQWVSSHDPSVFTHIGFAVPESGTLKLYRIEGGGRILPAEWPPKWETLRAAMTNRMKGQGRPPNPPSDSTLIEIPIFAESARAGPGPEIEWMIFEVDQNYIRTRLLPRLVAEYLNPVGDAAYEVSVSWAGGGRQVIFSTRSDGSGVASQADSTASIFPAKMGIAPVRGRFRGEERLPRWTIAVRHRAGSLDALVSRARTRNLIASLVLVGLLAGC